jgi:hypothetical protein
MDSNRVRLPIHPATLRIEPRPGIKRALKVPDIFIFIVDGETRSARDIVVVQGATEEDGWHQEGKSHILKGPRHDVRGWVGKEWKAWWLIDPEGDWARLSFGEIYGVSCWICTGAEAMERMRLRLFQNSISNRIERRSYSTRRHTVFAYRRPISSDRLSQAASTRIQPRLLEAWLILYRPGKRGRVGDIYFCEMAVRGYMSIYVLRSTNGGEEDAIMGRTCRIKQASYLWYGYSILEELKYAIER